MNRHPSTIGRELKRNQELKGYRPKQAQRLSGTRRKQADKARNKSYPLGHKQVHLHHGTVNRWLYADKAAGGG